MHDGLRLCRAYPDDCPNGPEPHAYHSPECEGLPCCRQPAEQQESTALQELGAMQAAYSSLRELDASARERALLWLGQRLRNLGGVPF